MKAKGNSIGILSGLTAAGASAADEGRSGYLIVPQTESAKHSRVSKQSGLSGLGPGHDDNGEFWETVGFVTIWLCGLSGIGVCFF